MATHPKKSDTEAGLRKKERNMNVCMMHLGGMTNQEIALEVEVHPNTLARILSLPESKAFIKAEKARLDKQAQAALEEVKRTLPQQLAAKTAEHLKARFDQLAPRATERMNELMEQGENLTVSLKASQDILNRAESSPKVVLHAETKSESTERHVFIDAAMLRQMHLLATPDGLIDVTPAETPELPERFAHLVRAGGTPEEDE